jgi:hypothetical protein
MKILLIMFACAFLHKPDPVCKEVKKQKEVKATKKQQKATYNRLAPSIIIINY